MTSHLEGIGGEQARRVATLAWYCMSALPSCVNEVASVPTAT
jgi:hypothetical protein